LDSPAILEKIEALKAEIGLDSGHGERLRLKLLHLFLHTRFLELDEGFFAKVDAFSKRRGADIDVLCKVNSFRNTPRKIAATDLTDKFKEVCEFPGSTFEIIGTV